MLRHHTNLTRPPSQCGHPVQALERAHVVDRVPGEHYTMVLPRLPLPQENEETSGTLLPKVQSPTLPGRNTQSKELLCPSHELRRVRRVDQTAQMTAGTCEPRGIPSTAEVDAPCQCPSSQGRLLHQTAVRRSRAAPRGTFAKGSIISMWQKGTICSSTML